MSDFPFHLQLSWLVNNYYEKRGHFPACLLMSLDVRQRLRDSLGMGLLDDLTEFDGIIVVRSETRESLLMFLPPYDDFRPQGFYGDNLMKSQYDADSSD